MDKYLAFLTIALPEFYQGLLVTLQIAGVGLFLGFLVGLPIAFMRVYGNKWMRSVAMTYTELFRGIPLLVLLFVVYYGFPDLGLTLSPMLSSYLALGLNSGAYQSEYFRGAIKSVSEGQMVAARSIGMSKFKAIRYIIIPQTLRLALPAWSNEAIAIVKYTAVVYVIAVPDLLTRAKLLSSKYYTPIESYLSVAVVYVVLVGIMTIIMGTVERVTRIPGLEIEAERH